MLGRLRGRTPQGIPPSYITAFNALGLSYARQRRRTRTPSDLTRLHLEIGTKFCRRVLQAHHQSASLYVYNSAGLELLKRASSEGLKCVLEQTIAPRETEEELLAEEAAYWPDWCSAVADDASREYIEREREEWKEASLIVCGSDFVRTKLVAAGVSSDRTITVPYGVPLPLRAYARSRRDAGPLRVLTVGSVGARKGAPYLFEVARKLRGTATFRAVGTIDVPSDAEAHLRQFVDLVGPVPRDRMHHHFAWADAFFLPSVCEGSATATYEALAHSLPVVTTPNCGSIVRTGIDGYIVPIRDTSAMAERLGRLAAAPDLLAEMSSAARMRADTEGTVEAYGHRLMATLTEHGIV
jgi:hypothetical protein